MRADRLPALAAAYEVLWRSRTPARDVSDVLARNRVTFSDVNDWHTRTFGEALDPFARRVLRKLRQEFPGERWD